MKTTKLTKIPKCDLCSVKDAMYDAPLATGKAQGSWAYLCPDCYKTQGRKGIGTKLVLREPAQPPKNKTVLGLEPGFDDLEYWEETMMDGLREISCPECQEVRSVEPDATYTYLCDCGVKVKVPMGLC
jgi:hypothetical protein